MNHPIHAAAGDPGADSPGGGVPGSAGARAVTTLVVADFDDTTTALAAYQALTALDSSGRVRIEGAVVVAKAADGALTVAESTDRSTGRGATWGAIGGAVIGVLFPPAILGSTVVAGMIGAAIGKGAQVAQKRRLADELHYSIDPGHSGLVALVSDPDAVELGAALTKANRVVRTGVKDADAASIRAVARQAVDDQAD